MTKQFDAMMEEAMSGAYDMLESIRAMHGEDFETMVRIALSAKKLVEIVRLLADHADFGRDCPPNYGDMLIDAAIVQAGEVMSLSAQAVFDEERFVKGGKELAHQVTEWAERLHDAQYSGLTFAIERGLDD